MRVVRDAAGLAPFAGGVFVPTMGALHAGHIALIRDARKQADARAPQSEREGAVVVSIFVNPTQFNDRSDFDRYPVTLDADLAACEAAGADVVFVPSGEVVYPPGESIPVPPLPAVAGGVPGQEPGLEDAHRPGHFAGVCQVVRRLFELVRPAMAMFGEKDWQQYRVIESMTAQEKLDVAITASPTVRESDGLAMSSRNRFLTSGAGGPREQALSLVRALRAGQDEPDPATAERTMRRIMEEGGVEVEYAAVREARSLLPLQGGPAGAIQARALVAGRVGSVRLIDNAAWGPGAAPL